MAKQIEIMIPQPCHEDWNKMTIEAQGRHCNSCKKTVIDFSLMSDELLVSFFKEKPANICGRFTNDQLNKEMLVPAKKIPWLTYFFQISLPLFLLSLKATAQHAIQRDTTLVAIPTNKTIEPLMFNGIRRIDGLVKGPDGKPLANASIVIVGTQKGTTTDRDGHFSLSIKGIEKFIQVSIIGYETMRFAIGSDQKFIEITLKSNVLVGTLGMIIVRSKTKKEKKKKESVAKVCDLPNSILAYPNPLTLTSSLTLQWKYPVSEEQEIEIYSISGEMVQRQNTIFNKYTNTTLIQLSLKNTGNYIVRTTDRKTHQVLTTQLLVN